MPTSVLIRTSIAGTLPTGRDWFSASCLGISPPFLAPKRTREALVSWPIRGLSRAGRATRLSASST
jgi:hypothetical protein